MSSASAKLIQQLISSRCNSLALGSIPSPGLEQSTCSCSQAQSLRTCPLLNAPVLLAMVEMAPVKDRFGLLLLMNSNTVGNLPAAALGYLHGWIYGWRCTLATATGKYRCFRTALSIRVAHLERESVGSVSELSFLPLHQGTSGSFSVQQPLHHCREGGNTGTERHACFWLATTERKDQLRQAELDETVS